MITKTNTINGNNKRIAPLNLLEKQQPIGIDYYAFAPYLATESMMDSLEKTPKHSQSKKIFITNSFFNYNFSDFIIYK